MHELLSKCAYLNRANALAIRIIGVTHDRCTTWKLAHAQRCKTLCNIRYFLFCLIPPSGVTNSTSCEICLNFRSGKELNISAWVRSWISTIHIFDACISRGHCIKTNGYVLLMGLKKHETYFSAAQIVDFRFVFAHQWCINTFRRLYCFCAFLSTPV